MRPSAPVFLVACLAASPAAAAFFGGAEDAAITGAWTCTISDPADPGMDGSTAKVEYLSDGTTTGRAELYFPGETGRNMLTIGVIGAWQLADGKIVESLTEYRVLSVTEAGTTTPWAEVDPELRSGVEAGLDSIKGVASTSTVETLSAVRLVTRDIETGATTDCTRD